MKWTTAYIKLLISMRKDKEKLFNAGCLRKKAIWSRIAQEFNKKVDDVFVAGDKCQSKWKKLEQKCKDVKFTTASQEMIVRNGSFTT